MKKCKKLLTALLIASLSVLSISTPALAKTSSYVYDANKPIPGIAVNNDTSGGGIVTPQVWWPAIYRVTDKVYLGTVRYITKWITANWAKASSYSLAKGESTTYSLQTGLTGEFENAIKASGQFTTSWTFSSTVTTTIPADSSRFSKLTYQCDYKRYFATVYKIPAYDDVAGTKPQPDPVFIGKSTVDEPTDVTYAIVVYQ